MRPLALSLAMMIAVAFAGCTNEPATQGSGPTDEDPFAGNCDYAGIEVGDNAYYVGGVADEAGNAIEGIDIRAVDQGSGEVTEDFTNAAGCYFLSLDGGAAYDIAWSHPDYDTAEEHDVVLEPGEKRVRHFIMRP